MRPVLQLPPKIRGKDQINPPWTFSREDIEPGVIHCIGPDVVAIEISVGHQRLRQDFKLGLSASKSLSARGCSRMVLRQLLSWSSRWVDAYLHFRR